MKVLAVCQYYAPEPFVISNMLSELVKRGHEVHVITGLPNYGYNRIMDGYDSKKNMEEIIDGVHVHRVVVYPRKDSKLSICRNYLSFFLNSRKYVKKMDKDFDIVFSMTLSPVIAASAGNWYKKKYHVPHLHYCVDLWPNSLVVTKTIKEKGLIYNLFYKWSQLIYKGADKILISSPSFASYFHDVLKINIHIDVLYQPSLPLAKDIALAKYEPDTFNIVYCGNMGKLQLLHFIYETMDKVKEHTKIRFHLIGMGSYKETFFQEVKKRGLEHLIIDHGPLPSSKAASYLKSADALYLGLSKEGFVGTTIPNKLIFYLSFGKPIIAMIDHDARDLLKSTGAAIIVDEDSDQLYRGIEQLMNMTEEERKTLGNKAQQAFVNNYQLSYIVQLLEGHLFSLKKASKEEATTGRE